jgi:tousled-like kinase
MDVSDQTDLQIIVHSLTRSDVLLSNKVDVWSIGVIYFQMLFGRRPFGDGQTQDHILRNQTMLHATEVHFPTNPSITEEGKSFIRDCLTYDQSIRPNICQLCEHGYVVKYTF